MKPILKVDKDSYRVHRGGSGADSMLYARVATGYGRPPDNRYSDVGFRLAWSVQ